MGSDYNPQCSVQILCFKALKYTLEVFKHSSNVIGPVTLEIKQVAVWEQGEISGRKTTRNDCIEANKRYRGLTPESTDCGPDASGGLVCSAHPQGSGFTLSLRAELDGF